MTVKAYHVVGALAAVMIVLIAQFWSMYPAVFPDEYIHSRSAIWLPFDEANITGYLYYLVYWLAGAFGEYYLQATRVLNALFHIAGCYLIYLTSSQLIESKYAAIISVSVSIGPLAAYVAFFMPDSMYFFFFWAFLLSVVIGEKENQSYLKNALISGGLFGLLWLTKPHALFLLPVYPVFLVIRHGLVSYKKAALFLIVATAVKFIFSYAVAGEAGLSWFGSGYSEHGTKAVSSVQIILQEYEKISINVIGHLISLAAILGLSLVLVIGRFMKGDSNDDYGLSLIGILSVVLMVCVVSVFAISVHIFEDNTANRLYVRYYGFVLPLFFIVAFRNNDLAEIRHTSLLTTIVAIIVAVLSLAPAYYYFARNTFYPFKLISTDIPEISLLTSVPTIFYLVSILGAITIFIWLFNSRNGLKVFGYITLPLISISAFTGQMVILAQTPIEPSGVVAGLMLREYVQPEEHGSIMVAGTNRYEVDQVRMYAKSGRTQASVVKLVTFVPDSSIRADVKWIITPDSLAAPENFSIFKSRGRVLLYKRVQD